MAPYWTEKQEETSSSEKQRRKQLKVGLNVPAHTDVDSSPVLILASYGTQSKVFNLFKPWFLLL